MWKTCRFAFMGNNYHVEMLRFQNPSQYGIEEGRISKLWITENGKEVCNYDRGWDVMPRTTKARQLLTELLKKYN